MTRVFLLIFVFAMAACGPAMISGQGARSGDRYSSTFVTHAIGKGPLPTRITGNPSSLGQAEFERLTLSRLRLEGGFPRAVFATDVRPGPNQPYHLALVFNPADRLAPGDTLCTGESATVAAGAELYIRAAFCRRGEALTTNFARLPTPASFSGTDFQQALDQVITLLMPAQDPPNTGTDCDRIGRIVPIC